MPVVLMGAGEQQENLSRTRERRAPYFSPLSPGLTLIGTQGTCHMHPCAPTTCHSARQCVFFELKLRQSGMERLAGKPHFEPRELGELCGPLRPRRPKQLLPPCLSAAAAPQPGKEGSWPPSQPNASAHLEPCANPRPHRQPGGHGIQHSLPPRLLASKATHIHFHYKRGPSVYSVNITY